MQKRATFKRICSALYLDRPLQNSKADLTTDINDKRNVITGCKKFIQIIIATSLVLTSTALLSIPIIIYYIKAPEINTDISLPNHVVDLQTCQATMNIVSYNLKL